MQSVFARVQQGERQVVFLSGEAGIGKTSVVHHFLAPLHVPGALFVARGQCVERYGPGEAYLPLLEALGQLCHSAQGGQLIEVLRRLAPLWLAQFPALWTEEEAAAFQRQLSSDSRERMLRQLAEAVEAFTTEAV